MNSKERLTRCYFGHEIDRPAVYSRTSFPDNDATYDKLKEYLNRFSDQKANFYAKGLCESYKRDNVKEAYSPEYDKVTTILHTPKGELQQVWLNSRTNQPGFLKEYFIKDASDCEKYLSLPLPRIDGDCSDFFKEQDKMGNKGIVEVFLGNNPGGTVADLMGSETFAMLSITDRELLHALCRREMDIHMQIVSYVIDAGLGPFFAIHGQEYIVPPLHGRVDFDDFNVRYDKPIIDLIHEAGGRVHVHCHGSLRQVLSGFLEMGADVLHPIEPPPLGDITAGEARAILGDKVCIEGNIQIANMYESSPEQIIEETAKLIKDAFVNSKGLIVSPTASPYIPGAGETCFLQYKAMIDTMISLGNTRQTCNT